MQNVDKKTPRTHSQQTRSDLKETKHKETKEMTKNRQKGAM